MNIAIIGRGDILYDTAIMSLDSGHSIKLIVTAREAPEYKKTSEDFMRLAERIGARFVNTPRINDTATIAVIRECTPLDIGVSVNYTNVISEEVISIFQLGIINCHGGDLPRYRGNACTAWAIINGEERVGLCIHRMEGGKLDSGDIIAREYYPLTSKCRIGQVYKWFQSRCPPLFMVALFRLSANRNYCLERQNTDPAVALRCYPRIPEDGKIDWRLPGIQIIRLVNASSEPYSGAYCLLDGVRIIVWRAEMIFDHENYCAVPGQVARLDRDDGSVVVISGEGNIRLTEIEYEWLRTTRPAEIIRSIRKRLT